ncbi:hypothetical protein [Legionella sp. 27cVA30]|nr:hypothetical protein [Legionella sp. 27cVA30]
MQIILTRIFGNKVAGGKNLKNMSLKTYLLELLAVNFLKYYRKTK